MRSARPIDLLIDIVNELPIVLWFESYNNTFMYALCLNSEACVRLKGNMQTLHKYLSQSE
jgi:hypothetical protein